MAHQPLPDVPRGVTRTIKAGGKTYWYYDPARAGLPGKRRRLPGLGTLDWFDEIEAIRREQSGDAPAVFDIRSLVDDFKQTAGWRRQAGNTTVSYDSALKPILAKWRYRRAADIAISDVVSLIEHLADHPAAANMTLVMVRKLMRYAIQKGLRADNPGRDVPKLEEVKDGAKPITPAAWAALRDPSCPVAVHRLGILGRYTGQRISDLITMRPCDRDEDGISHKIKKLKNRPHWSFLTPEQAVEIDGWNAPGGLPYIVKSDGIAHTTDSLRHAWNAYARTDAGKALAGFTPHDLRATKVCDERIAGKTHQQIAAMVGMSIQKVMHYSKHIDQRQAARGTEKPATESRAADIGPLGRILDLVDLSAYLRVPTEDVAAMARLHGIGAVFGESMRFRDEDVQALWECARRPTP